MSPPTVSSSNCVVGSWCVVGDRLPPVSRPADASIGERREAYLTAGIRLPYARATGCRRAGDAERERCREDDAEGCCRRLLHAEAGELVVGRVDFEQGGAELVRRLVLGARAGQVLVLVRVVAQVVQVVAAELTHCPEGQ